MVSGKVYSDNTSGHRQHRYLYIGKTAHLDLQNGLILWNEVYRSMQIEDWHTFTVEIWLYTTRSVYNIIHSPDKSYYTTVTIHFIKPRERFIAWQNEKQNKMLPSIKIISEML